MKKFPRYIITLSGMNPNKRGEPLDVEHKAKGGQSCRSRYMLDYNAFAALAQLIEPHFNSATIAWYNTDTGESLHTLYIPL